MKVQQNKIRVSIHPGTMIILACSILLLPWQWIAAWIFATFFHELCHYIVLYFFRCPIWGVEIGLRGVRMETGYIQQKEELLCAIAGPLGSFILLITSKWFPRTALCGVFQGAYNLIPVYPLDGGRIFQSTLQILMPRAALRIAKYLRYVVVVAVLLLAVYCTMVFPLGIFPAVMAILFLAKLKIPCKEIGLWYNSNIRNG